MTMDSMLISEIKELVTTSKFMDHITDDYLLGLKEDELLIRRDNEKLIGILITKKSNDYKKSWINKFTLPDNSYVVCQLVVHPHYQMKGIGKSLIQEFIKNNSTNYLTLSVSVENTGAIQFYEKTDWIRLGLFDYKTETKYNIDLKLLIYQLKI